MQVMVGSEKRVVAVVQAWARMAGGRRPPEPEQGVGSLLYEP